MRYLSGCRPCSLVEAPHLRLPVVPNNSTSHPRLIIDHDERFEDLARAPIVEAVIQINGRVQGPWEEASVSASLRSELPEYSKGVAFNAMRMTLAVEDGAAAAAAGQSPEGIPAGAPIRSQPVARNVHAGFEGVRVERPDGKWVAQFTREFFAISRLAPYGDWQALCSEALRLWAVHSRIGRIEEVNRIACRFINRIDVPLTDGLSVADYFVGFGEPAPGFAMGGFMHSTVLLVPGHPYVVNLIRTHQPPQLGPPAVLPLILDLEASVTEQTSLENAMIEQRLADLRWVKNKVFFASITDRVKALCGASPPKAIP